MSSEVYAERILRGSIGVQHEAGEGAVLVVVAPVRLSAVQLDVNLVPGLEVQDSTVAGVVVVLIGVLGDGTGSHLEGGGNDISAKETCLLFQNQDHGQLRLWQLFHIGPKKTAQLNA